MAYASAEDRKANRRRWYREKRLKSVGRIRLMSPDLSIAGRLAFWGCYTGDCIVWTGKIDRAGYGHMQVDGKTRMAHRVAYESVHGPIPEGMEIDHLCRNRPCINAAHLEAVTPTVNVLRSSSPTLTKARFSQRTHCRNGHEYSLENTRFRIEKGYLGRVCKACERASHQGKP